MKDQFWKPGDPLTEEDKRLLEPVYKAYEELGYSPGKRDIPPEDYKPLKGRFRIFRDVLQAAGLPGHTDPEYIKVRQEAGRTKRKWRPGDPVTEREEPILESVRRAYEELGRTPRESEMPGFEYRERFMYWTDVLAAAGLPPLNDPEQIGLREEAKRKRMEQEEAERRLKQEEERIRREQERKQREEQKRLMMAWKPGESLTKQDTELLWTVRNAYKRLGYSPGSEDVSNRQALLKRFLSWERVIEAAGLPPRDDPEQVSLREKAKAWTERIKDIYS